MVRTTLGRRLAATVAAAAGAVLVFAGPASAAPAVTDPTELASQLLPAAAGDPTALAALQAAVSGAVPADLPVQNIAQGPTIPAQFFPIPAYSDTGAGNPVTGQVHGSGIATNLNGEFRFGFFGGPGEIAPDQGANRLNVLWINLNTGKSGTNTLNKRDVGSGPTIISTDPIPTAQGGTVVAGIYGTILHRWFDPALNNGKGDWHYQVSTIWFPSLGTVLA